MKEETKKMDRILLFVGMIVFFVGLIDYYVLNGNFEPFRYILALIFSFYLLIGG